MKNKILLVVLALVVMLILSSCYPTTANDTEKEQVNQQQEQYVTGQPVPQFTWSLTRHELIEIYKAKNNAVSTYAVVYNPFKGVITFECPSVGYPIPGGTQLTNPESKVWGYEIVLPQAEPDGTYSPNTSAGTYVMCRSEEGFAYPVYIEENVMTFPYMVTTDENGRIIKASESEKPSINISVEAPVP